MQKMLGIKVDTASMTLEELEESRSKIRKDIANNDDHSLCLRKDLMNLNHQILMIKLRFS